MGLGDPHTLRVPNSQYGGAHCSRRSLGCPKPHTSLLGAPQLGYRRAPGSLPQPLDWGLSAPGH